VGCGLLKKPPYVSHYRDRHRKLRWRYRRPGFPESQTTELFGSDAWWAWYAEANAAEAVQIGAGRTLPGSISALVVAFYQSAEWQMLRPTTQRTYRGILDAYRTRYGTLPVAKLQSQHVRRQMDAKASTPAAANNMLKVIRRLFDFAVERRWRTDNPTLGVKPLRYRSEGFREWSEADIAAFQAKHPVGTRPRLTVDLLLYTGQRPGDVRQMGRQHVRNGFISVRQEKTGAFLEIEMHPALKASIEATALSTTCTHFIVTQHDRPYSAKGFGNYVAELASKAGLPEGCTAHGLRKAAARRLAEAGCSAHEIAAITGHKSLKEVERYTRAAAQKGLGQRAMARLQENETGAPVSNFGGQVRQTGG